MQRDYSVAVARLRDMGVMINGSFVFGMDDDDDTVFDRTVEWAVSQGITTATFHILTPYPGTSLYNRMVSQGRMLHKDWDLYDTRHVVFKPAKISAEALEAGYWKAYKDFYSWSSIFKSALAKDDISEIVRHVAYAGGWKKFEPFWKLIVHARQVSRMLPMLEGVLSGFNKANRDLTDKEFVGRGGSEQKLYNLQRRFDLPVA